MPQLINKKETAVLFSSSDTYAFALYVSIRSFLAHSPRLAQAADIFIYAYRWSEETKKLFTAHLPVQIRDYELPDFVPDVENIRRFTPALFARFESFELLQHYQNVVCLDSDILVQKELIHTLQAPAGTISLSHDNLPNVQSNFSAPIPGYDMSRQNKNAGFIVLRNPLPAEKIHPWLYQMLAKHADKCSLGDQGIINLLVQEFQLPVVDLPQLYNLKASAKHSKLQQAYIIHSTGPRKFWQYYYFDEWYRYYAQYRQAGGGPAVRKNTATWGKFLQVTGLKNRLFFELAPDGVRSPDKLLRFWLKYLFKIKY